MSDSDFDSYDWDNDDEWQVLIRKLDFPASYSEEQKERFILKRKFKHYKKKNPDFEGTLPKPSNSGTASSSSTTSSSEQKAPETPQRQSSSSSSSSQSSSASSSWTNAIFGKIGQYLNYVFIIANTLTALLAIVSVVIKPFFHRALIVSGITHVVALFQNQGKPKLSAEYGQALLTDSNLFCAMYSFLFYLAPANMIYIAPVFMRSGFMACYLGDRFLKARFPALYRTVQPLLAKPLSMQRQIFAWIPLLEVYVGIVIIVNIFLVGGPHLIITMVYWQILRTRYMLESGVRSAFTSINRTIESALSKLPPVVLTYWRKVTTYAHQSSDLYHLQQAQAQQAGGAAGGGGAGGLLSRCNIL